MYKAKYFIQSSSIKQRQSKTLWPVIKFATNNLDFTGNLPLLYSHVWTRPDLLYLLLAVLNRPHVTELWLGRIHIHIKDALFLRLVTLQPETKIPNRSSLTLLGKQTSCSLRQRRTSMDFIAMSRTNLLITRCWSVERTATTMKDVFKTELECFGV